MQKLKFLWIILESVTAISSGTPGDTVMIKHQRSFGVDLGDHFIIPGDPWYVSNKQHIK